MNPPNKTAQAAPESTEVSTPPHDMDSQTLKAGVTAVAIFVVIGIFAYNHWWPTNHIALFQPKDDGGNIVIDIGKNQPPPDTTQSDTGTKPAVNKATTPSSEPTMGCWLDGVQLSATEVYHCPD